VRALEKGKKRNSINPNKILEIERDRKMVIIVDFSPFKVENLNIAYFESHLETGYPSLWKRIDEWEGSYSELVKRTTELIRKTQSHIEQPEILPRYNLLRHSNEYLNSEQFLWFYFRALSLELEGRILFEVETGESLRGEVKWYNLKMLDNQFADSSNKKKDTAIEEKNRRISQQPTGIRGICRRLQKWRGS
jgi:hypothetical protein